MESSRQWENQRLAALYRLGSSPVVVTTPDALVQRCIPPRVLERTALTLAVGQQWDLNALTRRLAGAGYTRCDQVEGPGQFALRGGILDVFSPGMEQPVRCEFFDDEIDSLGIFDAATQRRVENRREALLLPAAEVLPGWEEHTAEDAAARLEAAVKRLARRQGTQALRDLLTADAALLRQGVTPNGADRCMAAVYPEKTTALDYLSADALICVEDSGRTAEALRGWLWQLKEDVSAGMEAGFLAGELADFAASEPELALGLEKHPVVQLDGLTTGRQLLAPKDLLQLTAKQLSSYGGSLELACTDLTHYLTSGYRVMVLCGGEVRARNLRRMLADRKIPAAVDLSGEKSPEKGTVLIAVGALSAGCEYPEGRLAVLTEGQLTTPLSGRAKKPRPRRDSNQQKLQSYTDLTPGDLVVHAHHGIGRFVAMLRMPVDGVEKDYIKIAYAGQDVLYVPATSLDLVSKYIGPGEDNERTKLNKLGGHRVGQDHPQGQGRRQGSGRGADPAVCPAAAAGRPCLLAGQPLAAGV
ncbi:MAG: CarD family transcriptional regulator [Oscillospiraceae bacterium]